MKPYKAQTLVKIDGIVALFMALDRAMRNGDNEIESGRGVLLL
jgi:phage terminase large subunit-like protein